MAKSGTVFFCRRNKILALSLAFFLEIFFTISLVVDYFVNPESTGSGLAPFLRRWPLHVRFK
jgi:hypothetical protein